MMDLKDKKGTTKMTHEEAVKQANEVREGIEKDVDDLAAHFEGGIYGEDENGNWIVGYGVSGSANIVVTPDHVEFGSAKSEPFSPEAKAAIAELRKTLANC